MKTGMVLPIQTPFGPGLITSNSKLWKLALLNHLIDQVFGNSKEISNAHR